MSYLDIANRALADFRTPSSSARPSAIASAVRRIASRGGSVGIGSDRRLVILPPLKDAASVGADVATLIAAETETLRLLEALEAVKAAGVRLPFSHDGRRVIAIPRSQDSPNLRQALTVLGYALPIILTDQI